MKVATAEKLVFSFLLIGTLSGLMAAVLALTKLPHAEVFAFVFIACVTATVVTIIICVWFPK